MLKSAAFLLACLATTAPVFAFNRVDADRLVLIRTAKATGVTFFHDTAQCEAEPRLMGFFLPSSGQVHLCFDNMKAYDADPDLTLKHELLHAAQACRGGLLEPHANHAATAQVPLDYYPAEQVATEAEARALAPVLPLIDVARILVSECR